MSTFTVFLVSSVLFTATTANRLVLINNDSSRQISHVSHALPGGSSMTIIRSHARPNHPKNPQKFQQNHHQNPQQFQQNLQPFLPQQNHHLNSQPFQQQHNHLSNTQYFQPQANQHSSSQPFEHQANQLSNTHAFQHQPNQLSHTQSFHAQLNPHSNTQSFQPQANLLSNDQSAFHPNYQTQPSFQSQPSYQTSFSSQPRQQLSSYTPQTFFQAHTNPRVNNPLSNSNQTQAFSPASEISPDQTTKSHNSHDSRVFHANRTSSELNNIAHALITNVPSRIKISEPEEKAHQLQNNQQNFSSNANQPLSKPYFRYLDQSTLESPRQSLNTIAHPSIKAEAYQPTPKKDFTTAHSPYPAQYPTHPAQYPNPKEVPHFQIIPDESEIPGPFSPRFSVDKLEVAEDEAMEEIHEEFKQSGLYPEFLPELPRGLVNINFGFHGCVHMGSYLYPDQTTKQPSRLTFPSNSTHYYTLVLVDVESKNLHWMVVNIPGGKVNQGNVIAEFQPPSSQFSAGTHHYAAVALVQSDAILYGLDQYSAGYCDFTKRGSFNLKSLMASFNLNIVAGNYFKMEHDHKVSEQLCNYTYL